MRVTRGIGEGRKNSEEGWSGEGGARRGGQKEERREEGKGKRKGRGGDRYRGGGKLEAVVFIKYDNNRIP